MNWKKSHWHSLKTRISLATFGIFLLSLWSLSFYVSQVLQKDLTRLLGEQQLSTVSMMAGQIDQDIESRFTALSAVAEAAAPLLQLGEEAQLRSFVEQRPALQTLFNGGVIVYDRNGRVAAEHAGIAHPGDSHHIDTHYVAEVLKGQGTLISGPVARDLHGTTARNSRGEVVMAVPIFARADAAGSSAMNKGGQAGSESRSEAGGLGEEIIGVFSGVVELDQPNFLSGATEKRLGATDSYFLVAPVQRVIVSATDRERVTELFPERGSHLSVDRFLDGYEGSDVFVNLQGVDVLASAKRIPSAGWVVVANLPTAEAFEPIRAMNLRLRLAAVLLTLMAAGLTWWMVRRQLASLELTAETLAAMSEERLPLQQLPVSRDDEIGGLIGSFNRLIDALGQREVVLKQILDTSSVAIFMIDMNGCVTQANRRMAEMFAWPADSLVGQEYVALVHPDEREIGRQKMLDLLHSKVESVELDRRYWRADKTEFWGHLTGQRFHDASGAARGLVGVIADIDVRKKTEQALLHSKQQYDQLASQIPVGIYVLRSKPDELPTLDYASTRMAGILETTVAALEADVRTLLRMIHPDDRDEFAQLNLKSRELNTPFDWKGRLVISDTVKWLHISSSPERLETGEVLWRGMVVDITEGKAAEEKLQLAASVFTHAREGITITGTDGSIIDVNEAFSRITGYRREEVLGGNPRLLKSEHHPPEFYGALWRSLLDNGHWHGEIWNRRKNGEVFAELLTISAVRDERGRTQHYVALFTDITPMKEHERQLEHMAHFDVLTTLPNRVLLADRLHQAMAHAVRHRKLLAVAYLDLDGFKAINDRHGHQTGDQLLIALASRMKKTLREGDTLARLGGDEFVAVLLDQGDVTDSEPMLRRLLEAAAQPVRVGELILLVSASLGVSFFPQADEVDADQLLRQADQAMYQAKLAGKNRYHFFDAAQDRSVRGQHEGLQRIRQALADGEFVLYYQPKVNMRTGAVVGAEALIRWQQPAQGLLPPAAFLPLIENHPLAVAVGEWVIEAALSQMEQWNAAGWHIPVSVNVGARQLQQAGFVERLAAILQSHPTILPGDLSIEVLETSALEDLMLISGIMKDCRELGVQFALDDFGTGYSSLTYLKRLPVSLLKIDQSFVRDMLDDPDDLTILEGVISLASAFRRAVIAEGVETVEHGELLLQLGCELAQGYGIARPMPAEQLPTWARSWIPDPLWQGLSPISRDDFPLLFAGVEHRAWLTAMVSHLKDERHLPPPLDLHQCRFGVWLDCGGRARYAEQASFGHVERLHQQVHDAARALCVRHEGGEKVVGGARLDELQSSSKALLVQLQALLRESR